MSYYENRIKALEEKVAEMAKRERMKAIPVEAQLIDSIAKLKAEVERLRKAGDLLAFHYISLGRKFFPDDPLPYSIENWNAAKEGKPSV